MMTSRQYLSSSNGNSTPGALNSPVISSKNFIFSSTATTSTLMKLVEKIYNGSPFTNSQTVHDKMSKLIKNEKKTMKLQEELIREVSNWKDLIPTERSKSVLNEFNHCLEIQRGIEEELIQKQELLRLQLANVQRREQKVIETRDRRNKLYKYLREQESKSGDNANILLTKENLEELNISTGVVESQYARSVTRSLRATILEYMITLSQNFFGLKKSIDLSIGILDEMSNDEFQKSVFYSSDNNSDASLNHSQRNYAISNSDSGTPISMNPLNQNENMPTTANKYINILRNQLHQRKFEEDQTVRNGEVCNSCNHLECSSRQHSEDTLDKQKFDVQHSPSKKQSSGMFPGGIRIPSSLGNSELWKR